MSKLFISLAMLFAFASAVLPASAAAPSLDGKHYQGIAKIKGQPLDMWVDMKFDDTDVDINMAQFLKFSASYSATGTNGNVKVTAKIPGNATPAVFTSGDNGSTFEGKVPAQGQSFDVWVLNVPSKLVQSTLLDAELDATVGSPDGYTAFALVGLPDGRVMSATSDFVFNSSDHSFNMTCDTPSLQQIFSKMHGSYRVENGRLAMTDAAGSTVSGGIYDDGNYIKVILGQEKGITLTLVLIR